MKRLVFILAVLCMSFGAFFGFMFGDSYGRSRTIRQVREEVRQLSRQPVEVHHTDGRVERYE